MTAPVVFDRRAVRRHRDRAAHLVGPLLPLLESLAAPVLDRLDDVTRRFSTALELGGRGAIAPKLIARGIATVSADVSAAMAARAGGLAVALDEEFLPFAPKTFDLVIAQLGLHWVNDLPGALIQLRQALRPGGLLLAAVPLLGTLRELRTALLTAEAQSGDVYPRVSPYPDLPDCAGLLQRAGFVLPVAEAETLTLAYADPLALLRELRMAGEANAVTSRSRLIPPRALFAQALAALPVGADGRVPVTLRLGVMTGWAPDPAPPAS